MARGQRQGCQRQSLQSELTILFLWDEATLFNLNLQAPFVMVFHCLSVSVCLSVQVSDLKENRKYQFQVRAANMAGVGIPSLPSGTFVCEEWTIAVPGG